MTNATQTWEVHLLVDGVRRVEDVTVGPGSLLQASAEVKAIKAAIADGAKEARCTFSRFVRETSP